MDRFPPWLNSYYTNWCRGFFFARNESWEWFNPNVTKEISLKTIMYAVKKNLIYTWGAWQWNEKMKSLGQNRLLTPSQPHAHAHDCHLSRHRAYQHGGWQGIHQSSGTEKEKWYQSGMLLNPLESLEDRKSSSLKLPLITLSKTNQSF